MLCVSSVLYTHQNMVKGVVEYKNYRVVKRVVTRKVRDGILLDDLC